MLDLEHGRIGCHSGSIGNEIRDSILHDRDDEHIPEGKFGIDQGAVL